MRIVANMVLGFAAACGMLVYVDGWPARLLGMGIVILFSALCRKDGNALRRGVLTLVGCLLGISWFSFYAQRTLQPIQKLDGETLECTLRARDYSRETDYGMRLDATMEWDGRSYQVITYLDEAEPIVPGEEITGSFRLRVTTEAGENPSSYYQGKGVFLMAYQQEDLTRSSSPRSWREIPALLRYRIAEILDRCIPEDCTAFAKALLLGDTSELSYRVDTDLKVSGIRHVVAVSGLHISVLFAMISAVTFRKRVLTATVGIPLLFLFAAVAGFTPSVTRACIMSGLMLLSQLFYREYDGPTALSFAVLVMLIVNPYVVSSVSFQLSVASVLGIFLFSPGIRGYLYAHIGERKGRMPAWLRKLAPGVSITIGAQILTIPLCAWYFGTVSLVGALTNLLVLWAISLIFCLLVAVCLTAWIFMPLAGTLGTVAAVLIRYVLMSAKVMASFPLAAVYTASPYVTAWLVFVYLLLVLYFACGKPAPRAFGCCGILALCLALTLSWWEPLMADTVVTVLDVGQGQCILVQSGRNVYVVDCGGDSDKRTADSAAQLLLSRGLSRVNALILTHTDRDHAGGAENFLSRMPADMVVLPSAGDSLSVPERTKTVFAVCDLNITDADTDISIFPPVYRGARNEMSLCVLFESEKCDILITGDRDGFGERSLLRHTVLPDVEILMAGHHGSGNSTCTELLDAVKPEIVCISVGADNPYGHPHSELLERLAETGCAIYRTDRNGTITIRR